MRAATIWEEFDTGRARPGPGVSRDDPSTSCVSALAFGLEAGSIDIPVPLRGLPVEQLPVSARLSGVLDRAKVRVLGDLHGRSFDEFARQRNCGIKTLRELSAALRLAQHSGAAVLSQVAASAAASCTFVIPESLRDLKFADLPSSTRLEALVRRRGMQELGELHGCSAMELLRCSNIGVGTIQRLIGRASSGEFKSIAIEPSAAPVALLSLIEAGLSSLANRDRELLLDRIGARGTGPMTLEQLGHDYRLTKERARQIIEENLRKLKRIWGPRIPHLLEIVKAHCLSILSPLSAELLEYWIREFDAPLHWGMATHVRLIGALDRQFPCWPARRAGPINESDSCDDLMRSLLAGDAGVRLSDTYRVVIAQEEFRALTFDAFLQMLARMPEVALRFDQPEAPVLHLLRPNDPGMGRMSPLGSLPAYDRVKSRPERKQERAIRPAA